MGHYEREIVDYNPVTDRNYYGEKKYIEDENDKREAYERRRREDQSGDIKTYIDSIKSSSDFKAISKAEDAIENASYLSNDQKLFWRRQLNARIQSWERVEYNKREASYAESKKSTAEREAREKALTSAKKRYKNLSLFGKIKHFKQRPSTIDVFQQTSEEINQLYRRR